MAAADRGDAQSTPNLNDGNRTPWFLRDDLPWKGKLSKPEYEGKLRFEFDAKVRLRDGVHLSANIWRPDAPGKFPVVLMYTPYDSTSKWVMGEGQYFASHGYAFAGVDLRGRYGSEGNSYLYWHTDWKNGGFEGYDVQDTIGWLGTQPWSSGKVAMQGPSYLAMVQWMGGYLGSPYLAALVPECSPGDHYNNVFPGELSSWATAFCFLPGSVEIEPITRTSTYSSHGKKYTGICRCELRTKHFSARRFRYGRTSWIIRTTMSIGDSAWRPGRVSAR